MNHRLLLIFILLSAWCRLCAQQADERVTAYTDKNCYLAGERIHASAKTASASKVVYFELCDNKGMVAQAMAYLSDGQGWAGITLPQSLHSGNYMFSAYTRNLRNYGEDAFWHKIISVVNPQSVTEGDDIVFLSPEELPALPRKAYQPGQGVSVSLPRDSAMTISTLSVVRGNLVTADYSLPEQDPVLSTPSGRFTPELEGHIVTARPSRNVTVDNSRMVMVGKGADVYDGQPQQDGTWSYYTHDIHDPQPTLLNGYDANFAAAPMEFVSPYAQVVPKDLPHLQVWCTQEQLQERSLCAQQEYALARWQRTDTLEHTRQFLSTLPDYYYDMDEYTKLNTVKEALLEFVRGVRRREFHGTHLLFTLMPDGSSFSDWPALVLLDGMPVHDIDDILNYDARLLKYIQVYGGTYTFGGTMCRGVISFISKKGLLSNFKLDAGSHLVTYSFPQDHPTCVVPADGGVSTVYWNPSVNDDHVEFPAPQRKGIYQVILQGEDRNGKYFQSVSEIEVN